MAEFWLKFPAARVRGVGGVEGLRWPLQPEQSLGDFNTEVCLHLACVVVMPGSPKTGAPPAWQALPRIKALLSMPGLASGLISDMCV